MTKRRHVINTHLKNGGKPKPKSRRSVCVTLTVTLGSDSSSADELARGREGSDAIDTDDESASGAATAAQQRTKATACNEHGRTTCEHGDGDGARNVSNSHPQAANTINTDNGQRQRPVLKTANGESRKDSTKRKAGDDDELISDPVQPARKKTKTVTGGRAQQTPCSPEDNSQDSDSDGLSAVLVGEKPGEEESQWKHERYNLQVENSHPKLEPINKRTDSIVFQQVDIKNETDPNTGRTMLRVFGITDRTSLGLKSSLQEKFLRARRDFIEQVDPGVVIGYNVANFDWPYLIVRAKHLKAIKSPQLGRLKGVKAQVKDTHFSSKAYGQRDSKETVLDGRLQLDILQFMQREHKLRGYTLNSVCAQFLVEQKEDVHYSVIMELQNDGVESRRRLAVYSLKDAYLPQRLLDKLMCFSVKVLSQLFRRANEEGYFVPAFKSEVIETCLHKMLIDRYVKGAEDYTKRMISDLLQNKIDMSQLVITKALAKADYAAKQHVELAERMRQRDAGSAPALGDRVAYVIVKGIKGAAAYEKSEDPLYVLENNIPIDTKYYLENQLSKPLMRIFEPILGEKANSLLSGDHTRTIAIATPTVGGLMKFAVKTVTFLADVDSLDPEDTSWIDQFITTEADDAVFYLASPPKHYPSAVYR
ncbi:hypothetical protein EV363DRAFT_1525315 [Boletus edulis]|nr:hypothetical protein EV363DRAFT_1525315 [Boletus edulis]